MRARSWPLSTAMGWDAWMLTNQPAPSVTLAKNGGTHRVLPYGTQHEPTLIPTTCMLALVSSADRCWRWCRLPLRELRELWIRFRLRDKGQGQGQV